MNRTRVLLPMDNEELFQLPQGQGVTEAADLLQQTILRQLGQEPLAGLELGSGSGIITFMLARQRPDWQLTGIELQPELVKLATENNRRLGLDCSFIRGDLREHQNLLGRHAFGLVYANPPWVRTGAGKASPDQVRALGRQEIGCCMRDIVACLDWCLNERGSGFLIYPLSRREELQRELDLTGLRVRKLFTSAASPRAFIAWIVRGASGSSGLL